MTEFQKQVIELVNQGKCISEIAKDLGRNKSSVSNVVRRFNLHPKKFLENSVFHQYFDEINTELKAYFLGFFIADGCLNSDTPRCKGRFSLAIQEPDRIILDVLKKELHSTNPISIVDCQIGAKTRKPQAHFRWTSPYMRDVFNTKYKITSNKTKDVNFVFPLEAIDPKYIGAFVRGFIDGDGSFESHKGTFVPRIVGTSKTFLKQIGNIVNDNTGLVYKLYETKGKACTYYSLRWSANNNDKFNKIQKLFNFLYNNETICLSRKKDKIVSYLEYRANQIK